ncbi:type III secretion system inner membrane ring subunit SctD [Endozoicomonas sp. Mp262]|uniref:type III secretion system inner membrane ring subunit SctD n=1 Tax=Endozoicomonas sp. Mp262 TaxID=2919499 RepID=UPI0021D9414C
MTEFYLKILSGNHLGAEIPLEPGSYSLGKGENCDLILTDASLADIELIIDIAEDGSLKVSTETQHPLYLNGSPEGEKLIPGFFDVFTTSSIHFALGPADQDWPEIQVPKLQKPAAESSPGTSEDNDFPDPDADEGHTESSFSEEEGDKEDDTEEEAQDAPLEIDKKWLIGVPVAIIILMTVFAILLFSGPDESASVRKTPPLEQARLIKNQLQLPDIKIRQLPDNTLLVTGYTQARSKKEQLLNLFREENLAFRSQVVVMNDMRANADALLKNRGYKKLNIELDNTPGSLVLTGYVVSSDQLDKITDMLKEEIYGLNSVVDQVENQTGRVNSLKAMIKEKGLASRVHLIERPEKILIQGLLLDEGQFYKLKEVVNRFTNRFNNQPEVIIATRNAQNPQLTFQQPQATDQSNSANVSDTSGVLVAANTPKSPLQPAITVRGVSMGPIPYVIMEDGGKYLIGAKLDNGFIIEDISLDYLLLSNGKQKIKFQLGGKRGVTSARE